MADALKTLQDNIKALDAASKTASTATDFFKQASALPIGGPAGDAFKAGVNGAAKGISAGAGVGTVVGGIALTMGASAAAGSAVPIIGTVIGAVAGLVAGIAAFFTGKAAAEKKAASAERARWWLEALVKMRTVLDTLPPEFREKAIALLTSELQAAGGSFSVQGNAINMDIDDVKSEPALRAVMSAFPDKLLKQLVPGWLQELNARAAAASRPGATAAKVLGAVAVVGIITLIVFKSKREPPPLEPRRSRS